VSVTSQEIVEKTGATYRQLDHWSRAGYLRPLNPQQGSGTPRLFPDGEVAVTRLMVVLVKAGLLPAAAQLVARGQALPGGVRVMVPPPYTVSYRTPEIRETTGGVL
jgi:hypothetical protein